MKQVNNTLGHIDFINKYCVSDSVEIALYLYLHNERGDMFINAILLRNKIIDTHGEMSTDFKEDFSKYASILEIYLNCKHKLNRAYHDLFRSEESINDLDGFWDYKNPSNWIHYMSTLTLFDAPHLVELFSKYLIGPIIDVGGNNGTLSAAMKKINPDLDFTVWDMPQVIEYGKVKNPHINFFGGDFKQIMYPKKATTAVVKSVLHDHPEEDTIRLLMKLKKTVKRIIICEVMGDMKDIPWEQPYFSYFIPFHKAIRKPEWYLNVVEKMNMKIIWNHHIEKSAYQIIVIDTQ